MELMGLPVILAFFFSFIIGVIFGGMATFLTRRVMINRQMRIAERKAARIVAEAKAESRETLRVIQEEGDKARLAAEAEYKERRAELQRQENRLSQKSETLERKLEGVEQRERNLTNKEKEIESIRSHLSEIRNRQVKQLELISGMSSAEAKNSLLEAMEAELQEEGSRRLHQWEAELKEEADKKAQDILAGALQRLASEVLPSCSAPESGWR